MFCYKCGKQIDDDAAFCLRCGAKISDDIKFADAKVSSQDNKNDFIKYVDNYVNTTTDYKTAEDLINNSKPWNFMWQCFGILSVIGLILGIRMHNGINGVLGGLFVFGVFFGYIVAFIASGVIRSQYRTKYYGEFFGKIDFDSLRQFLDEYLKYISPYFSDWGFLTQHGILKAIDNTVAKAVNETRLCCEFGPNKKQLAIIWIRPDVRNPDSGQMQYGVDAVRNGFLIDGRAAGFLGHSCLIKTAPILHAAVEYYLQNNNADSEQQIESTP